MTLLVGKATYPTKYTNIDTEGIDEHTLLTNFMVVFVKVHIIQTEYNENTEQNTTWHRTASLAELTQSEWMATCQQPTNSHTLAAGK